jgi:predicted dithiol-disulfide oxidoreductase (DUF899 family)
MAPNEYVDLKDHPIVSREEWLVARVALLAKEKDFTRLRDELSRERRALPWVKVDKPYVFAGPSGQESLADLFGTRSQLIVYHFMFPPEWDEVCPHCSFWADSFNANVIHLNHRDASFVAISRAPLTKIEPFRQRMGWTFTWVSSGANDFNYDLGASFTPEQVASGERLFNFGTLEAGGSDREGISVFSRDASGAVFHTYSTFARGIDMMNVAYQYIDLLPKGREEDVPEGPQAWVRHHDRYED